MKKQYAGWIVMNAADLRRVAPGVRKQRAVPSAILV